MKVNAKATAKAVVILVFFAVLPLFGQHLMPSEFFNAFSTQGFDILGLLNKIALIGLAVAVLVLLRGNVGKASDSYLALSTAWKVLWLFIVFFALGLGHPETLGLAVISSTAGGAENSVTFDFRLFAGLATTIVALMIIKSIVEFQKTESTVTAKEPNVKPD